MGGEQAVEAHRFSCHFCLSRLRILVCPPGGQANEGDLQTIKVRRDNRTKQPALRVPTIALFDVIALLMILEVNSALKLHC